jgi:hypothetical protein
MLYDGVPVDLTPEQEEVATFFAVMKETGGALPPSRVLLVPECGVWMGRIRPLRRSPASSRLMAVSAPRMRHSRVPPLACFHALDCLAFCRLHEQGDFPQQLLGGLPGGARPQPRHQAARQVRPRCCSLRLRALVWGMQA